jgi:hypothetical protein
MGRPKGARNKATEFIKPIAQRFGPDCMEAMIKIVKHPKASNLDKVRAAELIMAYGYGRPVESHELSGPDGKPLGSFTAPPSVHVHFGMPGENPEESNSVPVNDSSSAIN